MSSRSDTHVRIGVRYRKCVSIDEEESGLGCGCICAACGDRLIAKKGKVHARISYIKQKVTASGWGKHIFTW